MAGRPRREALFTAARAVGAPVARALWLVLWLSLAYFALLPANLARQALNGMIAGMESGEPGWLAALNRVAASPSPTRAWPPRSCWSSPW